MLKIITYPNKILRDKSQKVTDFASSKISKLIPEMMEAMHVKDGVGLAAPQIGQNIRLVVICFEEKEYIMINPKITKKSVLKDWGEEGCLSLPGKYGEVRRHKRVTVKFQNEGGKWETIKTGGLFARIIQHEVDHLDGVLFIDRAKKISDIAY